MTAKERLLAANQGVDPKPTIVWPGKGESDVVIVNDISKIDAAKSDEKIVLVEVANPFGLALQAGVDLNHAQKEDPVRGAERLNEFVARTRDKINDALSAGADGVLYKLYGACEQFCTPMQYGGYYLEIERELLSEASQASLNILYVVGDEDTFIDFVSDLPAHAFAWDSQTTGFSVAMVRELRDGALCTNDNSADILLKSDTGRQSVAQFLTLQVNGSHA